MNAATRRLGLVVLAAAIAAPALPARAQDKTIEEGLLDLVTLHAPAPSSDAVAVIRPFGTDGADLGTGGEGGKAKRVELANRFKTEGPKLLAERLRAVLLENKTFSDVRIDDGSPLPEGAVVIEGDFTLLNPGSRAKRYWAGFGAGKSGVAVKGRVADAAGSALADFEQKRIGVMGIAGGDSEKKMTSDCTDIGEDIAVFLDAWVRGKPLEKK